MPKPAWIALVLSLALSSSEAFAYLKGVAGAKGATIRSSFTATSPVVSKVEAGRKLGLGDKAFNGFFRVNAGGGVTGWVNQDEVEIAGFQSPAPNTKYTSSLSSARRSGSSGRNAYLGPLLGFGFYTASTKLNFGVDGGFKLSPDWSLGVYFTYAGIGETVGTVSVSGSLMIIAPEVNYYFHDEMAGFHLGGKVGVAITSISASGFSGASGASVKTSGLAMGGAAGYDAHVSDQWTFGGELNLLVHSSNDGATTQTTSSESTSAFHILLSAKYWL